MHEINEMLAKLWSGNLKGRDFLRDIGIGRKILLN
jgi:hypothetical protein